jgi:hypothetical protein
MVIADSHRHAIPRAATTPRCKADEGSPAPVGLDQLSPTKEEPSLGLLTKGPGKASPLRKKLRWAGDIGLGIVGLALPAFSLATGGALGLGTALLGLAGMEYLRAQEDSFTSKEKVVGAALRLGVSAAFSLAGPALIAGVSAAAALVSWKIDKLGEAERDRRDECPKLDHKKFANKLADEFQARLPQVDINAELPSIWGRATEKDYAQKIVVLDNLAERHLGRQGASALFTDVTRSLFTSSDARILQESAEKLPIHKSREPVWVQNDAGAKVVEMNDSGFPIALQDHVIMIDRGFLADKGPATRDFLIGLGAEAVRQRDPAGELARDILLTARGVAGESFWSGASRVEPEPVTSEEIHGMDRAAAMYALGRGHSRESVMQAAQEYLLADDKRGYKARLEGMQSIFNQAPPQGPLP